MKPKTSYDVSATAVFKYLWDLCYTVILNSGLTQMDYLYSDNRNKLFGFEQPKPG